MSVTPSVSNMRDLTPKAAVMAIETTNAAVKIKNVLVMLTVEAQYPESVMSGTRHPVAPMVSVETNKSGSVTAKCAQSRTQKHLSHPSPVDKRADPHQVALYPRVISQPRTHTRLTNLQEPNT